MNGGGGPRRALVFCIYPDVYQICGAVIWIIQKKKVLHKMNPYLLANWTIPSLEKGGFPGLWRGNYRFTSCYHDCNKSHRFCVFLRPKISKNVKSCGERSVSQHLSLVSQWLHQSGDVDLAKELAAIDKATEVIQVPFWHQGDLVHLWNLTFQDDIFGTLSFREICLSRS